MLEINTQLSDFVFETDYDTIPSSAKEEAKLFIVDYFSACFAGKQMNGVFNNIVQNVLDEELSHGDCSVFCSDKRYSASSAAFMNAIYSHGADMDDGNKKAMGHIGCHVISTAFAVAEEIHASGKDILTAIVIGYDIYNRVAASVQPNLLHRGFHSTGVAGYLACAAVAAKLYKLSKEQIYNAISFAAVQSGGLMIVTESGQECKPINPANAAKTGIFSAKCAAKGLNAPKRIFESEKGWIHAFGEFVDEHQLFTGLGSHYTISDCYMKPYPSCRHTHCGLEAARSVREQFVKDGLTSSDILSVKLYAYENAIRVAGVVSHPSSEGETKFSIQYSLACMLVDGSFGLNSLRSFRRDDLNSLIDKIELVRDDSLENLAEGIRGARIEVLMNNGTIYNETVLLPKGEKPNQMTEKDVLGKLTECIAAGGEVNNPKRIIENVYSIDEILDFMGINSLLN